MHRDTKLSAAAAPRHRIVGGGRTAAAAGARTVAAGVAAALTAAVVLASNTPAGSWHVGLTTRLFVEQDRGPLLLIAALLLLFSILGARHARSLEGLKLGLGWPWVPVGLALGAATAAGWGAFQLFLGFPLSRDEVMADFDARVLAAGRLLAPIPEAWQPYQTALNPMFMLPVAEPFWISSYLPGNAALRAVVSLVLEPGWTGPILLAASMLCLASIARRLWPARRGPQLVALLVLVTSPQALTAAMTSYAMTAHLALNLLWLSLFLRDDRRGHLGAILVGWLATGLHQSLFHPLFVAPFILGLWCRNRTTLAARYLLAYLVIFGFWTVYPRLLLAWTGLTGEGGTDLGLAYFLAKVWWLLSGFSLASLDLMLKNLLRAVAWQNIACLVLVPLAWGAVRRGDGVARQLAAGAALTVAAMFVLLAYQGHGWGYRYIHGLLGNLALLAGYGWVAATSGDQSAGRVRTAFAAATLVTVAVLVPWQLRHAIAFVEPYRSAVDAIRSQPADVVLVDGRGLQFGADLVRNEPFLRDAPRILDYTLLPHDGIAALCRSRTVAVFDAADGVRFGIATESHLASARPDAPPPVRDAVRIAGCRPAATGPGQERLSE